MLTVNFVVVLNKIQVMLLSSHPSQRFYSISQERIISLTRKLYDQMYHCGLNIYYIWYFRSYQQCTRKI